VPVAAAPAVAGTALAVFPNPAANRATVAFRAAADGPAQVSVYNALGQRVAMHFDGPAAGGQRYELPLDGQPLAAGLYQVRLVSQGYAETSRWLLTH
jgi:hypothetical protein